MSVRRLTLAGVVTLCCALLAGILALACAPAFAAKRHVPGVPASFGSAGSGEGQFNEPTGVAVNDATGDVYVADKGNNRVEWFNSTGSQFEGQITGSIGPPQPLSSPEAVAVDNSGSALDPSKEDVYVADVGNRVIDQFTATGTYVGQLRETTGGALFGELRGVAVDAEGNVWVYDSNANIDEFTDTGSFVKTFNTERGTTAEDAPAFAVDSLDDVYVVFGAEQLGKYNASFQQLFERTDRSDHERDGADGRSHDRQSVR